MDEALPRVASRMTLVASIDSGGLLVRSSPPRGRGRSVVAMGYTRATTLIARQREHDGGIAQRFLDTRRRAAAHRSAWASIVLAVSALVPFTTAAAPAQPTPFSQSAPGAALPSSWSMQAIPKVAKQTRFDLVRDGDDVVLRARADGSLALLRDRFQLDAAAQPLLTWRWKTSHVIGSADMTRKDGDDYAARLYVFFDRKPAQMTLGERAMFRIGHALYGDLLPGATLCYVWDNRQPVGTMRDSAYTAMMKMIVASSGRAHEGQWVALQRDVAADYRAAFGTAPPPVLGIAVASDTDNTGESTVTWFGDIRFSEAAAH